MAKEVDILKEAVADAKRVKTLAIENAKQILVEQLQDRVDKVITEAISSVGDDFETSSPGSQPKPFSSAPSSAPSALPPTSAPSGGSFPKMSEAKEKDEDVLDLDELPAEEEPEEEVEEAKKGSEEKFNIGGEEETPEEKELKKKALKGTAEEVKLSEAKKKDEDESKESEEEFSDEEIEEVYQEIFAEVEVPSLDGKLSVGDHLQSEEGKEKPLEQVEAPAAKDFIPKEAYYRKAIYKAGRSLLEHKRVIRQLSSTIREVNLLNAKLVAVSRLNKLVESKDMKEKIIEFIDRAATVSEVNRAATGAREFIKHLTESKKVGRTPLQRSTSNVIPRPTGKTVVSENKFIRRQQALAGLLSEEDLEET